MALPDRNALMGMALGAVCATAIAAIGPGAVMSAIADEKPVGIDVAGLVKFEGSDYDVQYEDWVDTAPTSKAHVKKIEFGRVSTVDITTTATGTYSTDAMFSNNIQYPGIEVNRVPSEHGIIISGLGYGGQWVRLSLTRGSSFVHIRSRNHAFISGNGVSCVFTRYTTTC